MNPSLDRYNRQILLPGFGEEGQRKLLGASVLIVGCGALGTVLADTLARAGVGHLIIVDRDFIELTNLQRQVLFDENDVNEAIPKVVAAKRKLARINSQVKVNAVVDDLNHTNIENLVSSGPNGHQVDVIVDALDNFETRFLVNDCAVKQGVPYVYAGAVGTVGMTYTILPHSEVADLRGDPTPWEAAGRATPCLRCIFDHAPPPGMNPTCDTAGVLGAMVLIVAAYEAAEVLKILTGNWQAINPAMQHIDLWDNSFHQFDVAATYDVGNCPCCKRRCFEYLDGKLASGATTLCGRNAVHLRCRVSHGEVNLDQIAQRLTAVGVATFNQFMLRAHIKDQGSDYELSVFADGRTIVKGTQEPSVAKSIYAKYIGN